MIASLRRQFSVHRAELIRRALTALAAVVAATALLACGDGTGPNASEDAQVSVAFRTAASSGPGTPASIASARPSVRVVGTNGALTLQEVHLVVTDFQLRRVEDSCDDAGAQGACEPLEQQPGFMQLPLEDGSTVATSRAVPPDEYAGLEFETDDLEDDDQADDRQAEEALLSKIREDFPDWPEKASLRVRGEFQSVDADSSRAFTAYFETEREVPVMFASPATIGGNSVVTVNVTMKPSTWFTDPSGDVADLSQFDYATTGAIADFDIDVANGVSDIRVEK